MGIPSYDEWVFGSIISQRTGGSGKMCGKLKETTFVSNYLFSRCFFAPMRICYIVYVRF